MALFVTQGYIVPTVFLLKLLACMVLPNFFCVLLVYRSFVAHPFSLCLVFVVFRYLWYSVSADRHHD